MRRWILAAVLGLTLMFAGVPAMAAPAPVPNGDMGIIPPTRVSIPGYTPRYERYSVRAYTWDDDYSMMAVRDSSGNWLANVLMMLNAVIVKWAIRALEWSFTFPLVNDLLGALGEILKALSTVLLANWILRFGLMFAGAAAVWYGIVRRRMSQAIGIMVNVVLVLVIAFASLNGFLVWAVQMVNDGSTAVSGEILAGMSTVTGTGGAPGGNAFVAGSEAIWEVFVVTPWANGEFDGNMSTAMKHSEHGIPGGKFLGKSTKERAIAYEAEPKAVQETEFSFWQEGTGNSAGRLIIAACALLVGLAGALLILGLSGAVLVFSLLALFILLGGPFVWLAALFFPGSGLEWTMKWFVQWMGYLVSKIVLAAVLSVVIVVSMALSKLGAAHWGLSALLQVALVAAVAYGITRIGFKNAVGVVADMPGNPQRMYMQLQQRAARTASASRPSGGTSAAGAGGGALGFLARRGGTVGRIAGGVQGWREGREATATLNQKLATDRMQHKRLSAAGKKPEPTERMRTVDYRLKKGAQRIWTASEIKAEAAQNRNLKELGADPLAVAADGVSEEAYQRRVDAVHAAGAQTEQRTQRMRATYQPRVRAQRFQRSPAGQVVHAVWSGRLKDQGHGPLAGQPEGATGVPMPEPEGRKPMRTTKTTRTTGKDAPRPRLVRKPTSKAVPAAKAAPTTESVPKLPMERKVRRPAPALTEEINTDDLPVRVWLKTETNELQDAEVTVAGDGSARVTWDDGRTADMSWDWVRERATEDSRPTLKGMRERVKREKAMAPALRGGKK